MNNLQILLYSHSWWSSKRHQSLQGMEKKTNIKMVKKFSRVIWGKKFGFHPKVFWLETRLNIFWQELSTLNKVCSISASNMNPQFYNKIWKWDSGDCCFTACFKFALTLSYIFMTSCVQCIECILYYQQFVVLYVSK